MQKNGHMSNVSLEPVALEAIMLASPERREQFMATLRHELRTPMNHIIGYSEMLIEEAGAQGQDYLIVDLKKIHHEGQHLLVIINDLFAPNKRRQGLQEALLEVRHEMRTLVNSIIGFSEILQEELSQSSVAHFVKDLGKIETAARHLLGLIDGSTAPSKVEQVASSSLASLLPELASGSANPVLIREQCGSLLVVDDNDANRDMLSRRLERLGHRVYTAVDGFHALEIMADTPFDLILLDVMMPRLDGYGTLRRIKADVALRHIPVIMISALDDISAIVRCIEMGAEDYIPKPFDPILLKARIGASLEKKHLRDLEVVHRKQIEEYNLHLEDRVREQVSSITLAQMETIFALSKLAESRDPETGAHLERVREYCKLLVVALAQTDRYALVIDSDFIQNLFIASPLHDIGKVGIPDHILLKPGRYTDEEFAILKTHPAIGAETLRAVNKKNESNTFVKIGIEVAESHHEKWDGTGYPYGLAGDAIPLSARILAVADVYDALRAKRCYKEPFSHEKARAIIIEGSSKHFDPDLVECFLAKEAEFEMVWRNLNCENE